MPFQKEALIKKTFFLWDGLFLKALSDKEPMTEQMPAAISFGSLFLGAMVSSTDLLQRFVLLPPCMVSLKV